MKKFILLSLILISSFVASAQSDISNLPKYYIVENDTLGIIMSIEQCQKLDHNTELLSLYRKMSIDCDNVEKSYILVVNKLGEKIALLEVDIKNLKSQNDLQRDMITNLQNQIDDYQRKDKLNQEELVNKDIIIDGLKSDLRKQKVKTSLGVGVLLVFITFLIIK